MKVALCQINTTIGDFAGNTARILKACEDASSSDIAVFPELALSSYPPLDLLDRADFLAQNESALQELIRQLSMLKKAPQAIVLGCITRSDAKTGRPIANSAVVLEKKSKGYEIVFTQGKRLLPTYDVFDESRYFQPATETKFWTSPWGKIAITICEDAWFDHHYEQDPALQCKGADLVINISASPFEMNKREKRRQMLTNFVKKTGAPLVYVNQVGGNDEILFDGCSQVINGKQDTVFESVEFEESIAIAEVAGGSVQVISGKKSDPKMKPIALVHKALVTGIRDYFKKTGFSKAVLGLSGGIDSAVVAALAVEALGKDNVIGIAMPGPHSSGHSISDADQLAQNLGIEFRVHSIKFVNSTLTMELKGTFAGAPADFTEENIQSRLRGVIVLAVANKRGALALTTGNKSELAVGYCTTYGDMAGAIAPLGDLYKTKVYELARHINSIAPVIPESSITKPPSAELKPDQKDEDSLGPYSDLDRLLELHIEGMCGADELQKQGFSAEYIQKILKLVRNSEFKRRQAAPALKITSKAFGLGRRMPIAKRF